MVIYNSSKFVSTCFIVYTYRVYICMYIRDNTATDIVNIVFSYLFNHEVDITSWDCFGGSNK